jgi:phosphoribosylaminoimidazole-succinocarboxamide synthase
LSQEQFIEAIPHCLTRADVPGLGQRQQGKVRDIFLLGDRRVLVTTDRVSAFDRVVGAVPFKGQVLNQLAAWWFAQLRDLVDNHLLEVPDPNAALVREAEALQVEVIVRGFITGVTSTALWTLYSQGLERPYGLDLPPGLQKNDPLPEPVITPTTKAGPGEHDERLTCEEVEQRGLVEPELWRQVQRVALEVFKRGQQVANRAGMILVDTKYEFGLIDGRLALIDEVHTPDSSRFWVAGTYEQRRAAGQEPEQMDKEILRQWLVGQGYRGEGDAPQMPPDFLAHVAERYVGIYERLTGLTFEPGEQPVLPRLQRALAGLSHG